MNPRKTVRPNRLLTPLLTALLAGLLGGPAATSALAEHPTARTADRPAPKVKRATAKQAKALLDQAVARLQKGPQQAALADFNNPKGAFIQGDLYVFVVGTDGIMRAHGGAREGLVGMNVSDLRDAAGKPIIREMLDAGAKSGSGALEYVWLNRVSNRVENKTTLFRMVGDQLVGVGYYTPRSSAEQAAALLDRATTDLRASGAQRAFEHFNDRQGAFHSDDLYVFAVGLEDSRFYAMGATPELVGNNVAELRDAAGKPIIQEMIRLVKDKGEGNYEYVWRNPANNKVETKRSFVRKVDGYLLGVGYYTK